VQAKSERLRQGCQRAAATHTVKKMLVSPFLGDKSANFRAVAARLSTRCRDSRFTPMAGSRAGLLCREISLHNNYLPKRDSKPPPAVNSAPAWATEGLVLVKEKVPDRGAPWTREEGRKQKAEGRKSWCTMKNTQRVYQIHAALCPGQKGNPRDFVPVTFADFGNDRVSQ
jgi:hypothetical protein